jgi:segregation and condensation protein B
MSLINRIEALILAADEPLSLQRLRGLLEDAESNDIRAAIAELEEHYGARGIRLEQVGGGWQFRTAPEHAETVTKLWQTRPPRLSRAMLETLAIIAYRQPTTRAEIEALRGTKVSSSVMGNLLERGWVKVVGRKEVPGRPHLYGTDRQFLIDFGLNSLRDLPDSSQLLDEEEIAQLVEENQQHQEEQQELDAVEEAMAAEEEADAEAYDEEDDDEADEREEDDEENDNGGIL